MNIHEHQAKQLLAGYGVAVPRGIVAFTPMEAELAFKELGVPVCAVKSQIHAEAAAARANATRKKTAPNRCSKAV